MASKKISKLVRLVLAEDHGNSRSKDRKTRFNLENETQTDSNTLRKKRIELLAATVYARLSDNSITLEETNPNTLQIKKEDIVWKISIQDDGRVNISGFDSGTEQFVGKIPEKDAEGALIRIAHNITDLIWDDIDQKQEPEDPPIHYGPEEEQEPDSPEPDSEEAPPVAPEGDTSSPDGGLGGLSPDMGMGAPTPIPPPQQAPQPPAMGQSPMPSPPQQAPQPFPPPQQPAPFPSPTSSRWASSKRKAVRELDLLANDLERIGQSLGSEGEEVFKDLATRLDRVVNTIEQSV